MCGLIYQQSEADYLWVMDPALLAYLQGFISEERKLAFEKILENRTRHLTVVLENITDAQNVNAVIRSCECFGIQDVHVIDDGFTFKPARKILKGSHKWISINRYSNDPENTSSCIKNLRNKGYRIIGTSPHAKNFTAGEFPIDQPVALFFGQESLGISGIMMQEADAFIQIPMFGFTESLNISAAASILLSSLSSRLRKMDADIWKLSEVEKDELRAEWTAKSIYRHELLIERFFKTREAINEK